LGENHTLIFIAMGVGPSANKTNLAKTILKEFGTRINKVTVRNILINYQIILQFHVYYSCIYFFNSNQLWLVHLALNY
jgi:hypothetical protein